MESKLKFGMFISQKRKEQKLTQKDFASQLFVTESAVSKWERGISYPDISLVSEICRVLHISEHELVTASEDEWQRKIERHGNYFLNIIKTYSFILYGLYAMSLLVCFICNLAVSHTLDWFFIVLAAELTAFSVLNLPLLVRERKGSATIIGSFISVSLLLLICALYTAGSWFPVSFISVLTGYILIFLPFILRSTKLPAGMERNIALVCLIADTIFVYLTVIVSCLYAGTLSVQQVIEQAVPLVSIGLVLPWLYLLVIRYLPINPYYKTAVCLILSGGYSFVISGVIDKIVGEKEFSMPVFNLSVWDDTHISGNIALIILTAAILLGAVFTLSGIRYKLKR